MYQVVDSEPRSYQSRRLISNSSPQTKRHPIPLYTYKHLYTLKGRQIRHTSNEDNWRSTSNSHPHQQIHQSAQRLPSLLAHFSLTQPQSPNLLQKMIHNHRHNHTKKRRHVKRRVHNLCMYSNSPPSKPSPTPKAARRGTNKGLCREVSQKPPLARSNQIDVTACIMHR